MKNKPQILTMLFGLAIGFMVCVVMRQCETEIKPEAVHTIDTVFIDKPYEVKVIKTVHIPVKVEVYRDRDTTLRKEREKEPIIENVSIHGNTVEVTTIDTSGLIKTDIHIIEPDSDLKIDNTGQVEEKKKTRAGRVLKKTWKGIKTGLCIVGGVAVVVFISDTI